MYKRHNFPWSINETLQLQREYELLGLHINKIAELHKRSINAILYKIKKEGFEVNSNTNTVSYESDVEEEYDPYNPLQQLIILKKVVTYFFT
jgi:hypothetical protein